MDSDNKWRPIETAPKDGKVYPIHSKPGRAKDIRDARGCSIQEAARIAAREALFEALFKAETVEDLKPLLLTLILNHKGPEQ